MLGQVDQKRLTLIYGLAHYGKSLFWYSSEILFAYFLTELAGLPASQMGAVLAIGFLASAAIDVGVGIGLQRWLAAARVAALVQLVGATLSSAALASVILGAWIDPQFRYAYAIAAGIAFRFAYAVYDIPQNALMALATGDTPSRLRLASTRIWFSGLATLTVAGVVGPMIASNGTGTGASLLFEVTLIFALVAMTSASLLALALRRSPATARSSTPPRTGWRPSQAFWLLIAASLLTTIFSPAFGKLEPYFATYELRSAWWGGLVIMMMAFGIVAGQPLWLKLSTALPRAVVLIVAASLQIISLASFWSAGAGSPEIAAAAAFGFGLGNGGVGMVLWAAFSEVVARQPVGFEGIAYGLFVASAKIGLAVGGMLIATALNAGDFREPGGSTITVLMTLIPGCGAVLLIANGLSLRRADRSARLALVDGNAGSAAAKSVADQPEHLGP